MQHPSNAEHLELLKLTFDGQSKVIDDHNHNHNITLMIMFARLQGCLEINDLLISLPLYHLLRFFRAENATRAVVTRQSINSTSFIILHPPRE